MRGGSPRPPPPKRQAPRLQIIAECNRRALVAFHGSMAHKTRRTLGEPDFVILLPMGRFLLVECKTSTGALSDDQKDLQVRAALLGHTIHVVRSFTEFFTVLKDALHPGGWGPNSQSIHTP
jgi:hypothetical protein